MRSSCAALRNSLRIALIAALRCHEWFWLLPGTTTMGGPGAGLLGDMEGMGWSTGSATEASSEKAARTELQAVQAAVTPSGAATM